MCVQIPRRSAPLERAGRRQTAQSRVASEGLAGAGQLTVMDLTPETVSEAVGRFSDLRGHGTLSNVLAFGRALKELGVKVSLSQIIDAARSLDLVDIGLKS